VRQKKNLYARNPKVLWERTGEGSKESGKKIIELQADEKREASNDGTLVLLPDGRQNPDRRKKDLRHGGLILTGCQKPPLNPGK